jgi:hypothetical protein
VLAFSSRFVQYRISSDQIRCQSHESQYRHVSEWNVCVNGKEASDTTAQYVLLSGTYLCWDTLDTPHFVPVFLFLPKLSCLPFFIPRSPTRSN